MNRHWGMLIKPTLEAMQPESIVEIGSEEGINTRRLLGFGERFGAKVHVIDPAPQYDVDEWKARYGEHFVFHRALSLEVLPLIDCIDVALIDGDHNWYTVFNELKLIEERCEELGRPFPLVMLDDIGWPCGRRDIYYFPETIPEEYRHPYAMKSMRPGLTELLEEGGVIQELHKAIHEGGPRNGVLTAVENFLQESEQQLELLNVPGHNGFGILLPQRLKENTKLMEVLGPWQLPPVVVRYIEEIDMAWREQQFHSTELRAKLRNLRTPREERKRRRARR